MKINWKVRLKNKTFWLLNSKCERLKGGVTSKQCKDMFLGRCCPYELHKFHVASRLNNAGHWELNGFNVLQGLGHQSA